MITHIILLIIGTSILVLGIMNSNSIHNGTKGRFLDKILTATGNRIMHILLGLFLVVRVILSFIGIG